MTAERPFQADDTPQPQDDYGRSKLEAERRLLRIDAESEMRVAIIRPPLVYGPGVGANFLRLLSWAARGAPLPLASIENARSLVSVWNLCDLICCILRQREPVGGTFMVSDGEDISTPDLIRRLARSMRSPVRLFPMPLALLRSIGSLAGKSAELKRLCGSLAVDMSTTRARLDWSPPVTLERGLDRTARWYLQSRSR
jgi:nucleoside-diphosphate-sugar epimerase